MNWTDELKNYLEETGNLDDYKKIKEEVNAFCEDPLFNEFTDRQTENLKINLIDLIATI